MAGSLNILSFNVRGFTRPAKQLEILNEARALGAHIICVQETFFRTTRQMRLFDKRHRTKSYWSLGYEGRQGVGIILMPNSRVKVIRHARDSEGRVVWVDLDCGLRVVCVYAPTNGVRQREFFLRWTIILSERRDLFSRVILTA